MSPPTTLERVIGVPGAIFLGLGSILGTGVFVSIGIAAGVAGTSVILAIPLAAVVAAFNGLSSAQLAASHPVSGGTYEYGYRYLSPALGFLAGWMFLLAKSASAATAALGFAGYLSSAAGDDGRPFSRAIALGTVTALSLIVAGGLRPSNRVNAAIVSITILALAAFVGAGTRSAMTGAEAHLGGLFSSGVGGLRELAHATALLFVAYAGYGRIATLGEEVRHPEKNIPRAIIITLIGSALLYGAVTIVAVGAAGAPGLARAANNGAASLAVVAQSFGVAGIPQFVAVGALASMLGVLLNLLLGLSRVLLAMARRGDMPRALGRLDGRHASPRRAALIVGALVAALVLTGSVRATWSFSAFAVLVYYALTNLAALRLPASARLYPRWIPAGGLVSCMTLAFCVEPRFWATGLFVVGAGLAWHFLARRAGSPTSGG